MKAIDFKFKNVLPLFVLAVGALFASCDNATDNTENDIIEDVKVDRKEEKAIINSTNTLEISTTDRAVYNVTDVDRQPIFGLECPVKEDPLACSNEEILKFVKENTEVPKGARNQKGFEQVIVVIEKDGTLSDMKYVSSSKVKKCEGCQKAAVDVVGKMKNWTPGIKDGEPVAVQITIPVRFES
ncbi:energy transducer TonB [Portibacter marinus]|uniref:energy transducer TonB n=1 Tax=Portibacter marinus TaxID=2898660 RepID=UPI001F37691E|nr:energy transducer TonB [Portibacter marinus]